MSIQGIIGIYTGVTWHSKSSSLVASIRKMNGMCSLIFSVSSLIGNNGWGTPRGLVTKEVNLVYASLSLTGDTLIWTPFSFGGWQHLWSRSFSKNVFVGLVHLSLSPPPVASLLCFLILTSFWVSWTAFPDLPGDHLSRKTWQSCHPRKLRSLYASYHGKEGAWPFDKLPLRSSIQRALHCSRKCPMEGCTLFFMDLAQPSWSDYSRRNHPFTRTFRAVLSTNMSICGKGKSSFGLALFRSL